MSKDLVQKSLTGDIAGPANGARDVVCFDCRNSERIGDYIDRVDGGFHHQSRCLKGRVQPSCEDGIADLDVMMRCPDVSPRFGFQIGGYYSHMWVDGDEPNGCLEWRICSDGEFPTGGTPAIEFHLCDWHQIERWVEFWGKELRRRGLVTDTEETEVEE